MATVGKMFGLRSGDDAFAFWIVRRWKLIGMQKQKERNGLQTRTPR